MRRIILNISLLFFVLTVFSQNRKITKTGSITFEASVPAFEEVKATNKTVSCVLNTKTGEIASLALVKGFRFKVALMEEHFNENYIESNRFPKATFKGVINNFDEKALSTTPKTFDLEGTLQLHGKTKDIKSKVILQKAAEDIVLHCELKVKPSDFDIIIPKVVSKKVAESVIITIDYTLQ
ncbi:YceI family protein [Flavobacterium faecale]|uniref:YceI family protein n=1 Tax=Flavobacterium faecale TaxID=1355330 RepID=UPI003AAC4613